MSLQDKADKMKANVKIAAGKATDNPKQVMEGRAEKLKANVSDEIDKRTDKKDDTPRN